jgi:FkbM family methyltransferase
MNLRIKRNLFLQKILWNAPGFAVLRAYVALRRRADYVLLNHSLDSETNGEYWLLDNLPPKPVVLDVGFNTGDFTAEILSRSPEAQVFAFDPARAAERAFKARFGSNPRVSFVASALSDQPGQFEFHDYDNMCSSLARRSDAGAEASTYKVNVETLCGWFERSGLDRIDFLKIDAEGFDANVIAGALPLLKAGKIGVIMFEYANGWINNKRFLGEVDTMLKQTSCTLHQLFNGFLAPVNYTSQNERFDMGRMYVITTPIVWSKKLPTKQYAFID